MAISAHRTLAGPEGLHPTPGFSHVAIDERTRTAYVAGQTALAPDFSVIAPGDLRAQTVAAMRNTEAILEEIGASWDGIVRRTIYTTEPTRFAEITEAIEEVQGEGAHPAQTIVGISGLAVEGLLIEIEVTVMLP